MFHDESWKPIYFGIKRSKVKVTNHRDNAGVGHCSPVSACFLAVLRFWLQLCLRCVDDFWNRCIQVSHHICLPIK